MNTQRLKNIVARFRTAKVLVIGDLILDEYIWGSVERISPEAPVPVVWAQRHTYAPGGAANVANNIRALDGQVVVLGIIGNDSNGKTLLAQLKKWGVSTRGICVESGRHTTVKTRIVAGHQQVVRVDWEHTHALSKPLNERVLRFIKEHMDEFDAVIIEDYGKGVINSRMLEELARLRRNSKTIVTVDPKEEHFSYYRGVTAITPNCRELENAVRNIKLRDTTNTFSVTTDRLVTDRDIENAARQIMKYLDLESLLVTLGEAGMRLFEESGAQTHIPTVAQEVFDVSGAGDTVIAVFTLALAGGATKLEAAHIANYAAGIVVSKLGTATTSRAELQGRIGG
jgi:rfaE bifunctional protein kinase chain/domain